MPERKRLPDERPAITHAFTIGTIKFYLTVGLYDNGQPGEIFLKAKPLTDEAPLDDLPGIEAGKGPGGFANGMCDAFGVMASLALQHGCPLSKLCAKLEHTNFAPAQMGKGKSVMDYIAKWLLKKFPPLPEPEGKPDPEAKPIKEVLDILDKMRPAHRELIAKDFVDRLDKAIAIIEAKEEPPCGC